MNEQLLGIVIDPGHGGNDSGAIGSNMYEKDYNLLISNYMYDRLKELNIPVSITRNSDATLSPKERTDEILSFYGNNPNVIVISNHLNAGGGEVTLTIKKMNNKLLLIFFHFNKFLFIDNKIIYIIFGNLKFWLSWITIWLFSLIKVTKYIPKVDSI
mgnify:CR=1 FL=1